MVYPPTLIDKLNKPMQKVEDIYRLDLKDIVRPQALKTGMDIIVDTEWAFKADEIYNEIGIDLYKEIRPQVFAAYFNGIDVVGHRFTSRNRKKQKDTIDIFGDVQRNYYLYMNKVVGGFINLTDRNTIIIIAADHGLMRGEHTNNGVFIIYGPHIKKNIALKKSINLTDILPAILYLSGLPVAKDMDGQVFKKVISEEYLDTNEVMYIDSYGKREIANNTTIRPEFDDKILERLKSLRYLN